MTTSRRTRFLLLSLLVVLAGGLVRADSASRPFMANIDGNANPVPTSDPCVLLNTETGSGTATHIGKFVITNTESVNFCTNPEGGDINGQFTITAANGDQIFGTYYTVGHFDFQAGQITALGEYQIIGGTGRFTGATGSGQISAVGDLAPPFAVIANLSGQIGY
jgi:hypothetical protein